MKRVILSALAAGIFATAAAQEELTLRKCLEIGLENNYDIRIVRNEERISDNNATAANAGMVPTIDFEAGYSGALDNERTTPREGDAWSDNGIYDQTFNAGINLNWTIFDGFRIRTNYKKLKEMQEMGTVRTRITIEDFVASLTAEYYNYVQQTLRLQNFRYAVALSRERDTRDWHVYLDNDIELDGEDMKTIVSNTVKHLSFGNKEHPFRGVFDGQNHTVKGLDYANNMLDPERDTGFFAETDGATIKNFLVKDANIWADFRGGIIVGKAVNTRFENVMVMESTLHVTCANNMLNVITNAGFEGGADCRRTRRLHALQLRGPWWSRR